MKVAPLEELRAGIGTDTKVSRWFEVDQARINAFADVTEDHQFIHVDPEKARETPFGGPIAHGFLTLSLLAAMRYDGIILLDGFVMGVNYGFNKIRFMAPVPAGARIRARFLLKDIAERKDGGFQFTHDVSVEIEGVEKPALVAEWLSLQYVA